MVFILILDKNHMFIKEFNNFQKIPELSNHLLTTLASSYLASRGLCYREIT